ncbi:MAG TPA: glycine cleavage system protein GcvH [Verrucomicrobiae bacterium]|nr:glycine cleavage system protein GcvH [Verrucomicrobiae bacterium]
MKVPDDLKYTATHEWVRVEGDVATVGITDHAQAELTDIVYLELPAPGRRVTAKSPVAAIESVKAASDIYAPVSGEIVEVNSALPTDPGAVNATPYQSWMFKIRMSDPGELEALQDSAAYRQATGH